jgi:hypothetical protein
MAVMGMKWIICGGVATLGIKVHFNIKEHCVQFGSILAQIVLL